MIDHAAIAEAVRVAFGPVQIDLLRAALGCTRLANAASALLARYDAKGHLDDGWMDVEVVDELRAALWGSTGKDEEDETDGR